MVESDGGRHLLATLGLHTHLYTLTFEHSYTKEKTNYRKTAFCVLGGTLNISLHAGSEFGCENHAWWIKATFYTCLDL